MEPPNIEPEEENQNVRLQLIRHLIEAGVIAEENQGAMQELLDLIDAAENAEDDEGPIQRQLREMIEAEGNPLNQGQNGEGVRFPRAYMPDIDSGKRIRILLENGNMLPLALSYAHEAILKQVGYSFDGRRTAERNFTPLDLRDWDEVDSDMTNDIEIYSVRFALEALSIFPEFLKIRSFLGLAPCLDWQIQCQGHYGLGRRFVPGAENITEEKRNGIGEDAGSYHIWLILPVSRLQTEEQQRDFAPLINNPQAQNALNRFGMHRIHLPTIQLAFQESIRCFYMKIDIESRSTRIFINSGEDEIDKFNEVCERGVGVGPQYDPFLFVCSSISELLHSWVEQGYFYFRRIRETEVTVLQLGEFFDQVGGPEARENREIERQRIQRARRLMLELHELRSYQLRENLNFGYLSSIINEALNEHRNIRELLDVSMTAYLQVEKNLHTLAAWVHAVKYKLESAQKTTDSCLSTLSLLLNMRNNYSVEENTKFLATMAEHSSKENYQLKDIAEATQRDSESMKTIAVMTMFYLPASFVATLFSMGIFNFDFENGRSGSVALSSYWWIYVVVTIPLTICTFLFFWLTQRRQQNEEKATATQNT